MEGMRHGHFRDLQIWQRSMALARDVYTLTGSFPQSETFGLVQQMRRAAVSVPSNIAEGHGRGSDKSFALFLRQARGSLNELETQMELARQLHISREVDYSSVLQEIDEIERMLTAFVSSLRNPGQA
jgi:four helix bundle protein